MQNVLNAPHTYLLTYLRSVKKDHTVSFFTLCITLRDCPRGLYLQNCDIMSCITICYICYIGLNTTDIAAHFDFFTLLCCNVLYCIVSVAVCCTDDDSDVGSSMKVMLETFLSNLPNCVSRELIDKVGSPFSLLIFLLLRQFFHPCVCPVLLL